MLTKQSLSVELLDGINNIGFKIAIKELKFQPKDVNGRKESEGSEPKWTENESDEGGSKEKQSTAEDNLTEVTRNWFWLCCKCDALQQLFLKHKDL